MKPFVKKLCLLAATCLLTALFTGCAGYNKAWRQATTAPAATNDIAGPWIGTWKSGVSGHTGELRCIVTKKDAQSYQFRYHATFWKIFQAGYTVNFLVAKAGGEYKFSGQENLGWLAGGTYSYEGSARGTNFFSTYSSKYDHGTFRMTRPTASSPSP